MTVDGASVIHPEVLEGLDGWLFLREGNNHSFSYLNGDRPVEESVCGEWMKAITKRRSLGIPVVHLICPEKLAVFLDRLPGTVIDDNRLSIRLNESLSILYPLDELRQLIDGLESYSKTDTHFNDGGALVCVRKVLSALDINWKFDEVWGRREVLGDLGTKFTPPRTSTSIALKNRWPVSWADNGIRNRGRVSYYKNFDAEFGRLLLFGDSFSGLNLALLFSGAFREVLFVHSLGTDLKIVRRFEPDVILYEIAERFLRLAPNEESSVASLLVPKLKTAERDALLKWRDSPDDQTWKYVDWMEFDTVLRSAS